MALVGASVLAQPGGYELAWGRASGGGTTFSSGGAYTMGGTAGQAEAGTLSGGSFSLIGGFWGIAGGPGGGIGQLSIYVPVAMKQWAQGW